MDAHKTEMRVSMERYGNASPSRDTCHSKIWINNKRIMKSLYRDAPRNKLRRKILRGKKMKKSDKATEKEGLTYASGGF